MSKRARIQHGLLFCVVFLFVLWGQFSLQARQYAAIIIDAHTGEVIHQANPDTHAYPSSMTKMMTLYLVFKAIDAGKLKFTDSIKVSKHASVQVPCKLYLKPGSTITVKQAVLGSIIKSANDASVALAEHIAGSEQNFAEMMTQEARRLGMKNTVFKNASGLPNKQQVSTARDMARLGQALYKDFPHHFKLFKEKSFVYKGARHNNHNHLLERVEEVDGIKTGFINASGFNLTASMVKHGKRLIATVMGGQTARARDDHMLKLLNGAFAKISKGRRNGSKSHDENNQDIDQLLASLSQDELVQDAAVGKKSPKLAKELPGFETLDQLLAHVDEDQAELRLAKSEDRNPSLAPLKKTKKTKRLSQNVRKSPTAPRVKKVVAQPPKKTTQKSPKPKIVKAKTTTKKSAKKKTGFKKTPTAKKK